MPAPEKNSCARCGECCRRSSPTLHPADADLFTRGALSFEHALTLRRGEFVFDNISGEVRPLEEELIKIREVPGSRTCLFLDAQSTLCTLYDARPLQCRTLECWNPDPLVALFGKDKLERSDVIQDAPLLELVRHHETKASYEQLGKAFEEYAAGGSAETVMDILNFDLYLRDFVVERAGVRPQWLNFCFGRPMIECLAGFGYRMEGDREQGYVLVGTDDRPGHGRG